MANQGDNESAKPATTEGGRQLLIRSRSLGQLFRMPVCPLLPRQVAQHTSQASNGQGADVLLLHHPNPMAAAAVALARPTCPMVVFYHSDIVRQKALGAACAILIRHVLRRAVSIVVTSPTMLLHSAPLRGFRGKCVVVPLGVDPARWAPQAERERIEASDPLHAAFGARTVLFVGRLVYYKGVEVLLDAMASVPRAHLVLVGDGPLAEPLQRHARRLGIAERVHFAGRVAEERLRRYYHSAAVFALPSTERSEAFGIVQLEAMSAGLPVVSTRLKTGVPWVNRHRMTGLTVPPGDAGALAGALSELLDTPSLARRYGSNGQRRVRSRFTLADFRQRLWRVVEAAAASGGRAFGWRRKRPRPSHALHRALQEARTGASSDA